jgi:hypothetical protein
MVLARGIPKGKVKPHLILLTLGLSLLAATAQDRATKTNSPPAKGDYYSWQHPEWPPMPDPIPTNLPTQRIVQTNLPSTNSVLVDDRAIVYSSDKVRAGQQRQVYEMLRFPELQTVFRKRMSSRDDGPQQVREMERVLNKHRMEVTPAPYTWSEHCAYAALDKIGSIIATNRDAIRAGIWTTNLDGRSVTFIQTTPERIEAVLPAVRKAMASNDKADTLQARAAMRANQVSVSALPKDQP